MAKLDDNYVFSVLPKSISVEINDYNEADTFKMTLDYKNFPFDPRTIRALGVSIHMEDMKALFENNGSQKKLVPTDENGVFVGFADEENIDFDDEKREVMIEGRDYTALLIDQKFLGPPVDLSRPLVDIMKTLLTAIDSTKGIEIVNRTGSALPSPSSLATDFNKLSNKKNSRKGDTYWDVMQGILRRLGLVGYIEKDKFIIDLPRNAYVGRQGFTQFVYGLNLKTLNFKRKLGRLKGINIKVSGLDLEGKQVIEALIPKEAKDPDLAKIGEVEIPVMNADGTKSKDKKPAPYLAFKVSNIKNKDHLIKKGEDIYYEYSRQQLEGKLETKEMTLPERIRNDGAFTNEIKKIDFTKIRNGTPIEVFISQDDMNEVGQISSVEERKRYLIKRFYAPEVADALARTLTKVSTPFYTRSVIFTMDDNGFKMELDFVNIIDLDNANMDI